MFLLKYSQNATQVETFDCQLQSYTIDMQIMSMSSFINAVTVRSSLPKEAGVTDIGSDLTTKYNSEMPKEIWEWDISQRGRCDTWGTSTERVKHITNASVHYWKTGSRNGIWDSIIPEIHWTRGVSHDDLTHQSCTAPKDSSLVMSYIRMKPMAPR